MKIREGLRPVFFGLATLVAAAATVALAETTNPLSPRAQVRQMGPGINLFSFDPLWKTGKLVRIRETHLDLIKQAGFKTLRLNLMAFPYMDEQRTIELTWLRSLDTIVEMSLARSFNVIIDEHDFEACRENIPDCRVKLSAFWSQISERYKDCPATVMFEILNEPSRAITPAIWNEMLRENLAIIRKTNANRNVLIGPAEFNAIDALPGLSLPRNDEHIILTVHYYFPLEFTHQGFPNGNWFPKLPERGWGSAADRNKMTADFQLADRWAREHGLPVVLGEFGSFEKAPEAARAVYAEAAARLSESFGWAWIYWQFDKSFKIYEIEQSQWHEDIIKALIPAR